jgi:hypothetical protein
MSERGCNQQQGAFVTKSKLPGHMEVGDNSPYNRAERIFASMCKGAWRPIVGKPHTINTTQE